ncbi:hypothetical protein GUJ93_ZPchr0013g35697 [Zizania palustris]|uniref:Uncharacterized protein n=1 Tax=Zizania palustris TaxID=103762 RepID=A0A8J5WT25_ZIZPA|nr:hypothetical protein GUJ93_ZPchr0013g35697 [Zizania palustris]
MGGWLPPAMAGSEAGTARSGAAGLSPAASGLPPPGFNAGVAGSAAAGLPPPNFDVGVAGSTASAPTSLGSNTEAARSGATGLPLVAAGLPAGPEAPPPLLPVVATPWPTMGGPSLTHVFLPLPAAGLPTTVASGWLALGAQPPLLATGLPPLLGAATAGTLLPAVLPPLASHTRANSGSPLGPACWPAPIDVVATDAALAAALATAKTAAATARERERATALAWENACHTADALAQHVAEAEHHLGVADPPATVTPAVAADPGAAQLHA